VKEGARWYSEGGAEGGTEPVAEGGTDGEPEEPDSEDVVTSVGSAEWIIPICFEDVRVSGNLFSASNIDRLGFLGGDAVSFNHLLTGLVTGGLEGSVSNVRSLRFIRGFC
jgi:hypothetical protein